MLFTGNFTRHFFLRFSRILRKENRVVKISASALISLYFNVVEEWEQITHMLVFIHCVLGDSRKRGGRGSSPAGGWGRGTLSTVAQSPAKTRFGLHAKERERKLGRRGNVLLFFRLFGACVHGTTDRPTSAAAAAAAAAAELFFHFLLSRATGFFVRVVSIWSGTDFYPSSYSLPGRSSRCVAFLLLSGCYCRQTQRTMRLFRRRVALCSSCSPTLRQNPNHTAVANSCY